MNIGNIGDLLKAKASIEAFLQAHPKLPAFAEAVHREGIRPASVISVRVTEEDGRELETNLRVQESDLEFLGLVKTVLEMKGRPE